MSDASPTLPIDFGEDQMAETLLAFADPALDASTGAQSYHSALTLAVLAWNISLLPESKRAHILATRLGPLLELYGDSDRGTVKQIVEMLIERRLQAYSDQRRFIIDFELDEARHPPQLTVTTSGET